MKNFFTLLLVLLCQIGFSQGSNFATATQITSTSSNSGNTTGGPNLWYIAPDATGSFTFDLTSATANGVVLDIFVYPSQQTTTDLPPGGPGIFRLVSGYSCDCAGGCGSIADCTGPKDIELSAGSHYYIRISGFFSNEAYNLSVVFPGPLPITLSAFSASPAKEAVRLQWTTSSEFNNDYFSVLKSFDGQHFEEIGMVNGAGISNATNHYHFVDKNPAKGTSYYQLKQTDFNGDFSFSDIATVKLAESNLAIQKFNSTNKQLTSLVHSTDRQNTQISIFNTSGQLILQEKKLLNKGNNQINYSLDMPQGVYYFSISTPQANLNQAFFH